MTVVLTTLLNFILVIFAALSFLAKLSSQKKMISGMAFVLDAVMQLLVRPA
jgi:hypothetical protein